MPKRNTHFRVLGTMLGIGMLSATAAYADQPRDQREVVPQAQNDGRVHNTDITGGFYEDRYKLDDWYYDFYDSPGHSRADSGSVVQTSNDSSATLADAAHPSFRHHRPNRSEQRGTAQYAGDPWFYAQRDPLCGMPDTGANQSGALLKVEVWGVVGWLCHPTTPQIRLSPASIDNIRQIDIMNIVDF